MIYVVKERLENLPLTYVLNNITGNVPYRHNRNPLNLKISKKIKKDDKKVINTKNRVRWKSTCRNRENKEMSFFTPILIPAGSMRSGYIKTQPKRKQDKTKPKQIVNKVAFTSPHSRRRRDSQLAEVVLCCCFGCCFASTRFHRWSPDETMCAFVFQWQVGLKRGLVQPWAALALQ